MLPNMPECCCGYPYNFQKDSNDWKQIPCFKIRIHIICRVKYFDLNFEVVDNIYYYWKCHSCENNYYYYTAK